MNELHVQSSVKISPEVSSEAGEDINTQHSISPPRCWRNKRRFSSSISVGILRLLRKIVKHWTILIVPDLWTRALLPTSAWPSQLVPRAVSSPQSGSQLYFHYITSSAPPPNPPPPRPRSHKMCRVARSDGHRRFCSQAILKLAESELRSFYT